MSVPDIHQFRQELADHVVNVAASCRSNSELYNRLLLELGPHCVPRHLGQGDTRDVWELSHGLVLKVERRAPLTPEERRIGPDRNVRIDVRRRVATFNELVQSYLLPHTCARIYSALASLGSAPTNPSIIIQEKLTPLQADPDNVHDRVETRHMFITSTGELVIRDGPGQPTDFPLARYLSRFPTIRAANIGQDGDGRLFLMDTGNIEYPSLKLDDRKFLPEINGHPAHWFTPFGGVSRARNVEWSARMMDLYRDRFANWSWDGSLDR